MPIDDAELDRYLVDQASPIGLLTRGAPAIGLERSPAYVERAGSFPGSSTLDIGWGPDPILPHAVPHRPTSSFALDWPGGEVRRPYSATTYLGESAFSRRLRFRIDLPQLGKVIFLSPGHIRNFEELVAVLGDCWTTCLASRDVGGFLFVRSERKCRVNAHRGSHSLI